MKTIWNKIKGAGKAVMRFLHVPAGTDKTINICMLILMAFGSIMVVSTSQGTKGAVLGVGVEALKQGIIVIVSLFLYYIMIRFFSWQKFKLFQWPVGLGLLGIMLFVAIAGTEVGGARAWLDLKIVTLQPSELAKPLMIAICAWAVQMHNTRKGRMEAFGQVFRTPIFFLGAAFVIILIQRDTGTALILMGIAVTCFMVPGWKGLRKAQHWIKIGLAAGIIAALVGVYFTDGASFVIRKAGVFTHMATRIDNMKDPYVDVYGDGYQPANALYAIADAGLFGKGIGNSARKYGYLTQAESDYILAVVIEETGIIGLSIIAVCYGLILRQLFYYAFRTRSMADKVLLCGTGAYLFLHFITNVGGVITLIPMTGVPLLFISGGGTSMMSVCIAMGVAQAEIARINKEELA